MWAHASKLPNRSDTVMSSLLLEFLRSLLPLLIGVEATLFTLVG